jgi:hypothetical protein
MQALLPQYEIVLISGIGAGNEFLISELLEKGPAIKNQTVIFQWADPLRFDKLIQDNDWVNIAKSDPVYYFNFYQCNNRNWWLSSASQSGKIQEYHSCYIQDQQAQLRLQNQKTLIQNYLQNNNCSYYFTSTQQQMDFSNEIKFTQLRGNEIQPTPIVHFYFVTDVILPAMNILYNADRASILKNRIADQPWVAYDPDRIEIWQKLSII